MITCPPPTALKQALNEDEQSLVRHLAESLDRPLDVYAASEDVAAIGQPSSRWVRVATVSQDDQPAEPITAEAPVELLARATQADRPVTHGVGSVSQVAMRLGPRSSLFMVAVAEPEAEAWLERLILSATALHRATATSSELIEENESFASQLASDLEELTFLRSMVDRLSSSRGDDELIGMARATLPVLNATVRAKKLVFLRLPDPSEPFAGEVAAGVGEDLPSDDVFELIVRRFGPAATEQVLVRNWEAVALPGSATTWDEEDRMPGIQSMVLAPLNSGKRMLGWLVAVNRIPTAEVLLETSWQLDSDEFGSGEATLMSTTASILATHAANLDLLREKEQLMISMVRSLVSAIESKDKYTRGHSERVALYTRRVAEQLGYDETAADNIYLASLLHDVGKIGVSDSVLKKQGKLTDDEYNEISRHPDEGWAILCDLDQLRYVLPGVLHHHERWDGRGYPDGLAGEAIPLDGRIMAVSDAYDAMTSDRPYRKGMPSEKAESILRGGAGDQWDPACIEAFFACIEDIRRIKDDYQESDRKSRDPRRDSNTQLPHEVEGIEE